MRQYMIASTVTEAPSLVSVCSAMKGVVTTRVSMVNGVCSMYGNRKKMPGPRTPPKRPRRSTTLRSHSLQIRSEARIVITIRTAMMISRPIGAPALHGATFSELAGV